MKTKRKIALTALSVLIVLGGFFHFVKPAIAAGCGYAACSQSDITGVSDWALTAQDTITATFGGKTITFKDNVPLDGNHRYDAPAGTFCSGGGGGSGSSGVGSITIKDWSQVQAGADPVNGTVDIDYYDPSQGTTAKSHCINWGNKDVNVSDPGFVIVNSDSWIWSGDNKLVSGDNKTTLTPVNADNTLYGQSTTDKCNGGTIINLDAPGSTSGTLYKLGTLSRTTITKPDASTDPGLVNSSGQPYYAPGACRITSGPTAITILGSPNSSGSGSTGCVYNDKGYWTCNQVAGGGTSGGSSNSNSDGNACEAQNNTGVEWLICGILRGLDAFMTKVNNFIESQLVINVGQNLNANVKQAWNVFRILSSALLVIIMLVMVFSQAISAGPFDAYTVKKLLPRLVAAVIFIQISWYFAGWAVSIANDLGKGIADLIALPFGGTDQLSLDKLVGQLGAAAPGLIGVGGLISIGIAAWVTPFGALLLGFIIVTGAITATAVLLVRQALIIGAVIFMPLGLVAWILPGTQKYWKSLWDNFSKALLLFPLIIGMIYIGRVFAWIVSTRGGSPGILDAFAVVIGYFGPYFLLPKAFNWGGNIMKMAADNIEKGVEKMGGAKGKEFIQDRQKRLRELRRARSAERFADPNKYGGISQLWQKPVDRFRGGAWDPTLGGPRSELRTQQKGAFLAEAEEYQEKRRKEGLGRAQKLEERLQEGAEIEGKEKGGNKDDMYQDVLRLARGEEALKKYYDYSGNEIDLKNDFMGKGDRNHEVARRAALDRMIQLGADTNWTHISAEDERVRMEGTAEERANWRKFLNDNKDQVLEKMPDLLKGVGSVSDISAEGLARMHGAGIKRMLSKLNADATSPRRADETDTQYQTRVGEAQKRLNKFLNTAREAITNSNTRGLMEQGGLRALKAYVTEDDATREYLLYKDPYHMHNEKEDGLEVIRDKTRKLPDGTVEYDPDSERLLKPIIQTDSDLAAGVTSGHVTGVNAQGRDNVPMELRKSLDDVLNTDGSYNNAALQRVSQAADTAHVTPERAHAERVQNVQMNLPPAAALGDPTQRQAYVIRLRTDPATRDTLAKGIAFEAFGNDPAGVAERQAHERTILEWHDAVVQQGTQQDKASFNAFIDEMQNAHFQRVEEEVQRLTTPDMTPAQVGQLRAQVQAAVAPRITGWEAQKIL